MVLEAAWRATVQQLYRWRPLSRYWPLQSEVRDLVRRLGCARRGSRAGTRKAVRTNVNKSRSADRDAVAIPTITSVRRPVATSLQLHVSRRDARLPVRHPIELVAVQSSLLRCGLLNVCSLGNTTCQRQSATRSSPPAWTRSWRSRLGTTMPCLLHSR